MVFAPVVTRVVVVVQWVVVTYTPDSVAQDSGIVLMVMVPLWVAPEMLVVAVTVPGTVVVETP